MERRFLANTDIANPSGGLCDTYRLSGIASLNALYDACQAIEADHPGHRCLVTLDGFTQACYTSNHAVIALGLDDTSESDLATLPQECFEGGVHRGVLSTKAEFPIRVRNLARLTEGKTFADACGFGLTLDTDALAEWRGYQDQPLELLDQPLLAMLAPGGAADEMLAAFPNGYFGCDFGPALNVVIARRFRQAHGYELIGIGASYLGFRRHVAPDDAALSAILDDLCRLYNVSDDDSSTVRAGLATAVGQHTHLWLRYIE